MSKKTAPKPDAAVADTPAPAGGRFTESSTEAIECSITSLDKARELPELISDVAHHAGRVTFAPGAIQRFKAADRRTMVIVAFNGALAATQA